MTKGKVARVLFVLALFPLSCITYLAWGPRKPVHVGPKPARFSVAQKDWGHVKAYDGILAFTLGPGTEQTRRYELGFGRLVFTQAAIAVADDEHGKNLVPLSGEIQGKGCLFHAQGQGVNVLIAIKDCVPGWATVTGHTSHAKEWIRVENLNPKPKVVFIRYG